LIDPRYNPEMGFHVMQPGSSIATSLMPGEAVPKHVAILSVTGKEFETETIRLKSVRPFIMKEIVLAEEKEIKTKELWRVNDNRTKITAYLEKLVEDLIEEAQRGWLELQEDREEGDAPDIPLPLVRLRVEYTAPQPGEFHVENPQRFSNRFVKKVANSNDVVQFYRKKKAATRTPKNRAEMPEESVMAEFTATTVKVDKLVKEFLTAQTLTILPQNSFGDAVTQFVDKDDKHAMEEFVKESLANQLKHLMEANNGDDEGEDFLEKMNEFKSKLEEDFSAGKLRRTKKSKLKPKPPHWDSDNDGAWAEQPGALIRSDSENEPDEDASPVAAAAKKPAARGRGKAVGATRQSAAASRKAAPAAKGGRGKKKVVQEEDEEEDSDLIMVSAPEDPDEDSETVFVPETKKKAPVRKPAAASRAPARAKSPAKKPATRTKAPTKQATLNFSQPATQRSQPAPTPVSRSRKVAEPVGNIPNQITSEIPAN
jgi:double-strand break repair protein MRE11